MNAIFDVGNTNVKLAIFDHNDLINVYIESKKNVAKLVQQVFKKHSAIAKVLISDVSQSEFDFLKFIPKNCEVIFFDHDFNLPFTNLYQTPKLLGLDRLALAAGAKIHFPATNVLVIDAGTCMTYDFLDDKSQYNGGAISPGLSMRYKALKNQTAKLPLLEPSMPISFIGNTTQSSIHSGVVFGVLHEIRGVIAEYRTKYSEITIIMTGGDADFLCKQLKISIFANSNLLLEGLNYILEHNSNK